MVATGPALRPAAGSSPVGAWMASPSMIDWPGRMAAVLLIPRCNLRCPFCHNAGLLKLADRRLPWEDLASLLDRFRALWVDAVVISGGEPTVEAGLPELVRFLRRAGVGVKLDTNGTKPDRLAEVIDELDYVAMDVKSPPAEYPELFGFADACRIRASIELIRARARAYEFRTTVVPDLHDDARMEGIADAICGARRWVLQPFEPAGDLVDPAYRSRPRTPPARLRELRDRFLGAVGELIIRGE